MEPSVIPFKPAERRIVRLAPLAGQAGAEVLPFAEARLGRRTDRYGRVRRPNIGGPLDVVGECTLFEDTAARHD